MLYLAVRFPERKDVIDGVLAAVLAGEHVLLLLVVTDLTSIDDASAERLFGT